MPYRNSVPNMVGLLQGAEWLPDEFFTEHHIDAWVDAAGPVHTDSRCEEIMEGTIVPLALADFVGVDMQLCLYCSTNSENWSVADPEVSAAILFATAIEAMDDLVLTLDMITGPTRLFGHVRTRLLLQTIAVAAQAYAACDMWPGGSWTNAAFIATQVRWRDLQEQMAVMSNQLLMAWASARATPGSMGQAAWHDHTSVLVATTIGRDSSLHVLLNEATVARDGRRILLQVPRYVADVLAFGELVECTSYHRTIAAPDDPELVATAGTLWADNPRGPLADISAALMAARQIVTVPA